MDEHSRHVSDNSISSKNYSRIVPGSSAPVKDPLRGIWKVEVKPGSQTCYANTFGSGSPGPAGTQWCCALCSFGLSWWVLVHLLQWVLVMRAPKGYLASFSLRTYFYWIWGAWHEINLKNNPKKISTFKIIFLNQWHRALFHLIILILFG